MRYKKLYKLLKSDEMYDEQKIIDFLNSYDNTSIVRSKIWKMTKFERIMFVPEILELKTSLHVALLKQLYASQANMSNLIYTSNPFTAAMPQQNHGYGASYPVPIVYPKKKP